MAKFYFAALMLIIVLPAVLKGQGSKVKITATGTGNTTGHIANLSVHNMDKTDIRINEQAVYIPSDGQYQPYITTIPERTIPPGVTTIPLSGYCADVTTPPVPTGVAIPSVEDWVATVPDVLPRPGSGGINVVEKIVPQFSVKDIPAITGSPGFTPKPPPSIPAIQPTWPGSDSIVGGTINPVKDPVTIAPVLIDAISNIASAYDKLRNDGKITTPFSGDPAKERVSVIQQTFWIFTSALTSKKYDKENFGDKVVEQFETNTGTKVSAMPEPEKKKLEGGVDAFWNVFIATGVEAKVISEKAPAITSEPVIPKASTTEVPKQMEKASGCIVDIDESGTKEMLDYAIAETGTKGKNEKVKEAFEKAIKDVGHIISSSKGSDTVDIGFTTPEMPASAWSLYFPHVVAGQANATAFAIDAKRPDESAMSTEPLETKAEGTKVVVITHTLDKECKSTMVGVNFAKLRASSGLSATLGSIEALKYVNFVGEIAIDIVIQKGKGTYKKLAKYLKEKTKDMAKDQAKEYIKEQLKKLNKDLKGKTDEEAEKGMDELLKEIKEGEAPKDPAEETGEFLDDWIAEWLIEGDEINPQEKIIGDLVDKVDSPIDWAPIKTNTYAIGEGSLDVYVEEDHGIAKAASGASYKREELEGKEKAEKGGGVFCDAGIASQTTEGSITLKTIGNTGSWAGATGKGIIATGHGRAMATVESFNGMYVIAICDCPSGITYTPYASVTSYSKDEIMSGIWTRMFEQMMKDATDPLIKDIDSSIENGTRLPETTASRLQKALEDAAIRAAQSILPCETKK